MVAVIKCRKRESEKVCLQSDFSPQIVSDAENYVAQNRWNREIGSCRGALYEIDKRNCLFELAWSIVTDRMLIGFYGWLLRIWGRQLQRLRNWTLIHVKHSGVEKGMGEGIQCTRGPPGLVVGAREQAEQGSHRPQTPPPELPSGKLL